MAGSANVDFTSERPTRMSAARIATTMATARAGADECLAGVVTIKVPFAVRKRSGLKLVLAPNGARFPLPRPTSIARS
jgi:hypothetical protein